jgi:hypothetical protein
MAGTWKRLRDVVTVASNGDQIAEFTFDANDYLKVVMFIKKQGTGDFILYPNAITSGSNTFTARYGKDFGSLTSNTDHIGIHGNYGQLEGDCLATFYISNKSGEEKLILWEYALGASGDNAPDSFEASGKYTTKTGQITSFSANCGSGGFGAGTWIAVYGMADDVVTDEKATLTGGLPIGTRYEETDTRKIYRSTSVYSSVDSTASSLTDVPFDASTQIGDITYSGNELTRSADTYARHGLNSNFYFRNSGTQTVECVAQNTGTSSWVFFGLSASKLVDDGANTSTAPNQMAYGIKAADDGRTWIKSGAGNSWTQVSDTSDNTTFKITNNRTTVTYYVNGSSVGSTTHGTPASTYYVAALVSQTGTDGSFVFDYSGDITTASDNGWKERGSA